MASVPLDLVGQIIGRLTVVENTGIIRDKRGHTYSTFKCICDCGTEKIIKGVQLTGTKKTLSCGCYRRDFNHQKYFKYGNSKLYQVWISMKKRCNNPNDAAYHNYGGRGIGYAREWEDFAVFREWAYENGYQQDVGLTLERIDVNKGYTPENCCWDTRKRQSNNKRNNLYFTIGGVTHTLAEWCEIYNVPYGRVEARVTKMKWGIEEALSTPPYQRKEKINE